MATTVLKLSTGLQVEFDFERDWKASLRDFSLLIVVERMKKKDLGDPDRITSAITSEGLVGDFLEEVRFLVAASEPQFKDFLVEKIILHEIANLWEDIQAREEE